jgi:hypothetical protein
VLDDAGRTIRAVEYRIEMVEKTAQHVYQLFTGQVLTGFGRNRGRACGQIGREAVGVEIYPDTDDNSYSFRRLGRLRKDAAYLFAVDVNVIHPFYVRLQTELGQHVVNGDAGHQGYKREISQLDLRTEEDT